MVKSDHVLTKRPYMKLDKLPIIRRLTNFSQIKLYFKKTFFPNLDILYEYNLRLYLNIK